MLKVSPKKLQDSFGELPEETLIDSIENKSSLMIQSQHNMFRAEWFFIHCSLLLRGWHSFVCEQEEANILSYNDHN